MTCQLRKAQDYMQQDRSLVACVTRTRNTTPNGNPLLCAVITTHRRQRTSSSTVSQGCSLPSQLYPPTRNADNALVRPLNKTSLSATVPSTLPSKECVSILPLHPFIPRMPLPSFVSSTLSCLLTNHFPKVGIAAQLPSGKHLQDNLDYNSYWNFLLNRHDAYESLPTERLDGISYVPIVFNLLSYVLALTTISPAALSHRQEVHSSNTSTDLTT